MHTVTENLEDWLAHADHADPLESDEYVAYLCIMERPCPALECSLPPDSRHFKSCENCWAGTGP